EPQHRQRRLLQSRLGTHIDEQTPRKLPVERVVFFVEVRDEQVSQTVAVEVVDRDAHGRLRAALGIDGASQGAGLLEKEREIAGMCGLIEKQKIVGRVVGDVEAQPPGAVEVAGGDPQSFSFRRMDSGALADFFERSVTEIEEET